VSPNARAWERITAIAIKLNCIWSFFALFQIKIGTAGG